MLAIKCVILPLTLIARYVSRFPYIRAARRFDFFDSGVMEGLQHRLIRLATIASGPGGAITFRGLQLSRRHIPNEGTEVLVRWYPADM